MMLHVQNIVHTIIISVHVMAMHEKARTVVRKKCGDSEEFEYIMLSPFLFVAVLGAVVTKLL